MSATTHHFLTDRQAAQQKTFPRVDASAWVGRLYRRWRQRASERRAFALLGDRDLRDFGVSRWEVERELAKPFWRR